jgi:translation initiation factor IF-2
MSSQRPSFAKRDREMKLKDKARAKAEKRAARKAARAAGIDPDAPDAPAEMATLEGAPAATPTPSPAPTPAPAPAPTQPVPSALPKQPG